MNSLTVSEAGALGGKKRWEKIGKKARSIAMKSLADKRWAKQKKLSTGKDLQTATH